MTSGPTGVAPLDAVFGLFQAGGAVMPWLGLCTVLLWYALGLRLLALKPGSRMDPIRRLKLRLAGAEKKPTRDIVEGALDAVLARVRNDAPVPSTVMDEVLAPAHAELRKGRVLVRSLVGIAPLAGLLGTVTGMIETFRSLVEMAMFTQGGGIAGGIGEALLTTQMGLAIAVPGLVVGRMLDHHEARLHGDLDQLADVLSRRGLRGVRA